MWYALNITHIGIEWMSVCLCLKREWFYTLTAWIKSVKLSCVCLMVIPSVAMNHNGDRCSECEAHVFLLDAPTHPGTPCARFPSSPFKGFNGYLTLNFFYGSFKKTFVFAHLLLISCSLELSVHWARHENNEQERKLLLVFSEAISLRQRHCYIKGLAYIWNLVILVILTKCMFPISLLHDESSHLEFIGKCIWHVLHSTKLGLHPLITMWNFVSRWMMHNILCMALSCSAFRGCKSLWFSFVREKYQVFCI